VAAGEGAAYLFGGRDGSTVFDDLWRYDLAADAWSLVQPSGTGPAARFGHTGTWVEGVGLVVWSGQAGSSFFDDLWAYDPAANAWRELPGAGQKPAPRYGSCAALGPDGRLWISHGFTNDGRFDDSRAYDFAARSWADVTPDGARPIKRCLHDCLWTPDGRFLLYGGQTNGVAALGDLWARQGDAGWAQQPQPAPVARQLYALAALGDEAYVFGGSDLEGRKLADLWRLDLADGSWAAVEASGDPPAGRSGATLIADADRGRLLLFGGRTKEGGLTDLWELKLD
jgi:N-acetylneuraminic acid mutarotase